MRTRFVATKECDASLNFKKVFLHSKKEDIQFVKSPARFPGRAIFILLTETIKGKRIPSLHCICCMKTCIPQTTPYCISEALIMQ